MNPAVVVDVGWVNGLAAVRSLGRAGIRVLSLDHRPSALGFRSRYADGTSEFVHVGGATTKKSWGPMFWEQVRGHIRFLDKHRGRREAERARRLLHISLRLRGWLFPGERGRTYAQTADWLGGSSVEELLAR